MRKYKMRLNKKILLYEVISTICGCIGIILLAVLLMIGMFSRWTIILDAIWIGLPFILIAVYYLTNKRAYKLQNKYDYENRR